MCCCVECSAVVVDDKYFVSGNINPSQPIHQLLSQDDEVVKVMDNDDRWSRTKSSPALLA